MRNPRFEVVNDERLLKSRIDGPENRSGIYLRGNASTIEEHLGLSGLEILYVGDHQRAYVDKPELNIPALESQLTTLRQRLESLDTEIRPLADANTRLIIFWPTDANRCRQKPPSTTNRALRRHSHISCFELFTPNTLCLSKSSTR